MCGVRLRRWRRRAGGCAIRCGGRVGETLTRWRSHRRGLWSRSRRNAPRGALLYPRCSREELEGRFLGPMAYPDPKGERDSSMPVKRWSAQASGLGCRGTRVIWRKLDCLNPNLQTMQRSVCRKDACDRHRALCQRPSVSPHLRPSFLPAGGHGFSPLAAIETPHLVGCRRGSGQGLHPFAGGGLGEPVAVLAVGDDHVGVVQ